MSEKLDKFYEEDDKGEPAFEKFTSRNKEKLGKKKRSLRDHRGENTKKRSFQEEKMEKKNDKTK